MLSLGELTMEGLQLKACEERLQRAYGQHHRRSHLGEHLPEYGDDGSECLASHVDDDERVPVARIGSMVTVACSPQPLAAE